MKSGTSPKLAADHVEKASFFEAPYILVVDDAPDAEALFRQQFRRGSCVTSSAGPHGDAQLYWR
jgi:hypothetical protein